MSKMLWGPWVVCAIDNDVHWVTFKCLLQGKSLCAILSASVFVDWAIIAVWGSADVLDHTRTQD